MGFRGGDRVRLKDDDSDKTWIVYSVFRELNEVLILGFKKSETCHRVVNPAEIVSVDQNTEIKQAIREVLLSDEFLSAFAKAFANTPIPCTIQYVSDLSKGLVKAWTCEDGKAKQVYPEPKWTPKVGDWVRIKKPADTQSSACIWVESMNKYDGQVIHVKEIEEGAVVHEDYGFLFSWLEPTEPPKEQPQPPDGWRWLEVGEVIRKGDVDKSMEPVTNWWIGEACGHNHDLLRRNRFEVGEKVVRVFNGVVYKVIRILSMGYQLKSEFCAEVVLHGKDLAPYIEETM